MNQNYSRKDFQRIININNMINNYKIILNKQIKKTKKMEKFKFNITRISNNSKTANSHHHLLIHQETLKSDQKFQIVLARINQIILANIKKLIKIKKDK